MFFLLLEGREADREFLACDIVHCYNCRLNTLLNNDTFSLDLTTTRGGGLASRWLCRYTFAWLKSAGVDFRSILLHIRGERSSGGTFFRYAIHCCFLHPETGSLHWDVTVNVNPAFDSWFSNGNGICSSTWNVTTLSRCGDASGSRVQGRCGNNRRNTRPSPNMETSSCPLPPRIAVDWATTVVPLVGGGRNTRLSARRGLLALLVSHGAPRFAISSNDRMSMGGLFASAYACMISFCLERLVSLARCRYFLRKAMSLSLATGGVGGVVATGASNATILLDIRSDLGPPWIESGSGDDDDDDDDELEPEKDCVDSAENMRLLHLVSRGDGEAPSRLSDPGLDVDVDSLRLLRIWTGISRRRWRRLRWLPALRNTSWTRPSSVRAVSKASTLGYPSCTG